MAMPTITRFQLSAAWLETNLALLDDPQPAAAPMAFLGRPPAYAQRFDAVQHELRLGAVSPLGPPWNKTKGQRFWYYYLRRKQNADVTGTDAWQWLVPFHAVMPLMLQVDDMPIAFSLVNAFFYPHAAAFVVTVAWQQPDGASLDDMQDEALRLRYEPVYTVNWRTNAAPFEAFTWPSATEEKLSLAQIADHGMKILRDSVFGTDAAPGRRITNAPFTVLTVLGGRDVDLAARPVANGSVHRALHALTLWQRVLPGAAPLALDERVSFELGEMAGEADILYGQNRGRAVWYPSRFINSGERTDIALICYHRNVVFAALQLESLYGLARDLMERRRNRIQLTPFQRELARYAAGKLGLLYGGHRDTYRSRSVQKHIEQNGWVDTINALRQYVGLPPLHP